MRELSRLLTAALAVVALTAGPAAAGVGRTTTVTDASGDTLRVFSIPTGKGDAVRCELSGAAASAVTIRVSPGRVESLDLGRQGSSVFVAWDEREGDAVTSWFALSQDGGRSFGEARPIRQDLPMRYGTIVPHQNEPMVPAELRAAHGQLYLVQFKTISIDAWRDAITGLGGQILNFVPRQAHTVRMPASLVSQVESLPFVRWVAPFHPAYRLERLLLEEMSTGTVVPVRRYNVVAFEEGAAVQRRIGQTVMSVGGQVVAAAPDGGGRILEAELTLPQILVVAQSDDVAWIDRWSPPENDMNITRQFHGATYLEGAAGYTGTGVSGEVLDGGTMLTHQDFDGIQQHTGQSVNSGDHGTCTYGIVFGNGDRDGDGIPEATGMMPGGTGWAGSYTSMGNRKTYTQALIQSPMFCVFQSNSWGGNRTGVYNATSQNMDDIIFSYDILILNSMSNASFNTQVRPEAWAKNVTAVGGIRHKNTLAASDDTWGTSTCTGCSSQGPAEDGSFKPDISSFYDFVWTTDLEPGGYTSGSLYTTGFGGTSAATPIAAGAFGLFYQMWADNVFGNNPTGSTVFEKRPHAVTARSMIQNQAFIYPIGSHPTQGVATRNQQGWGFPNVQNLYDNASRMNVIDESMVLTVGQSASYCMTLPAGTPDLRITMSYLDPPGTTSSTQHRINDLSLVVTDPVGTVYYGNNGLAGANLSTPGGAKDTLNVTEHVFLTNPMAGDWNIVVVADEINQDSHTETPGVDADFALVVTGVRCANLNCCGAPPTSNVDIVTGPGPGSSNAANVRGFNNDGTSNTITNFNAYGGGYGSNVGLANIRQSASPVFDEILTGAGPGDVYGPQVRAFAKDGTSIGKVNFYAYGTLKFGVNVGSADVENDGYDEIISGAGPGAVFGPHVRGWNFDNATLTTISKINYFAYATLKYGVQVGGGSIDPDAFGEILTAPGPSGAFGSTIKGWNYDGSAVTSLSKVNFNPYTFSFGAHVTTGDVDDDGIDEIVTAPGPDPAANAQIRGYNYDGTALTAIPGFDFDGMPGANRYGATVDSASVDVDTFAEIVVGTGYDAASGGPHVRGWNYDGTTPVTAIATINFDAYATTQRYGVNVAVDEVGP